MDEMKQELEKIMENQTLLTAMKKSVVDSERKFNSEIEEFMIKHLNFRKDASFTIPDLIQKVLAVK